MTAKPAGEPDDEPSSYAISDIEALAKQIVKAAPAKWRWDCWDAYTGKMRAVREASLEYPWDSAETVSRISLARAQEVLRAVVGAIGDDAERARVAKIAAREAEKLEARLKAHPGSEVPGKLPMRHCQTCGKSFRPARPSAKFDSAACRQKAYKQRKAGSRDG